MAIIANVKPLAKSFTIKIENKYSEAKNLCLFSGTLETSAVAKDAANSDAIVFTKGNPVPVQQYSQNSIHAVMVDGVLPVVDPSKGLILPATSGECMTAKSMNPQFTIGGLKEWLKSNYYRIQNLIITVSDSGQFENPISFRTSSPTENLGDKTLNPTNFASPDQYNDKKIVIPISILRDPERPELGYDTELFLQDDTMMFWLINPNTQITMNFEFHEMQ